MPNDRLAISLTLDKPSYSPGDTVNYSIDITEKASGRPSKHDILIGVLATDQTSYMETDVKKAPPSIPTQVYLSKDIKPTKDYEFLNANEYIDFMFEDLEGEEMTKVKGASYSKLELLLGTQGWRLLKLDPQSYEDLSEDHMDMDNFDQYLHGNLLALNDEDDWLEDNWDWFINDDDEFWNLFAMDDQFGDFGLFPQMDMNIEPKGLEQLLGGGVQLPKPNVIMFEPM
jgi:hypothetical protein